MTTGTDRSDITRQLVPKCRYMDDTPKATRQSTEEIGKALLRYFVLAHSSVACVLQVLVTWHSA